MAAVTVKMQVNVGTGDAGDWANRTAGRAATGTGWMLERPRTMSAAGYELIVRLSGLRGAIEAMREDAHGPTLSMNHSSRASIGYGNPIGYRGMRFVTRMVG